MIRCLVNTQFLVDFAELFEHELEHLVIGFAQTFHAVFSWQHPFYPLWRREGAESRRIISRSDGGHIWIRKRCKQGRFGEPLALAGEFVSDKRELAVHGNHAGMLQAHLPLKLGVCEME
jgi:hypothetical protein